MINLFIGFSEKKPDTEINNILKYRSDKADPDKSLIGNLCIPCNINSGKSNPQCDFGESDRSVWILVKIS